MRGFIASSIGVTCAAALALPLTLTTTSHAAPAAARDSRAGSTQSLALARLGATRAAGRPEAQGLPQRDVRPFSLVGVVWDDPNAELHGRVQVRTRTSGTTTWSAWQDVETHNDDAPDPDTTERTSSRVRGATAPLWVGDSDGVQVRVSGELPAPTRAAAPPLPGGLRLELVDPGTDEDPTPEGASEDPTPEGAAAGASEGAPADVPRGTAPEGTVIPELSKTATEDELIAASGGDTSATQARPYVGARPRIVTRKGWGADEKLRERKLGYTKTVKAAFVHHSATGNNYSCAQAPSVIRGIYRYHVKSSGWRDIGYNFLVDKCGTIYEGRAGGVTKPVMGAHTLGFNTNSTGIAVLGSYSGTNPPAAAVTAIAKLTAWKLGLTGANPRGTTYLKSGGGNLYAKGKNVRLHVISGHRDGFATECPGRRLYSKLGTARTSSARLQGR